MSKQSEARKKMGYVPKLVPNTCSRCVFFEKIVEVDPYGYSHDKNLRCLKGGFTVKKMGSCEEWCGS